MSALIDTVADALVVALNAHAFTQAFTSTKSDLPEYELHDMDTLHVTVIPSARRKVNASRASTQQDIDLDIAIQKRYTEATAQTERDAMKTLVEDIEDFLLRSIYSGATCWQVENDSPCGLEKYMQELNQFTSIVTATFRKVA